MKASSQNIQNELENILDYMVRQGIAIYPNSRFEEFVSKNRTRLTWQRGSPTKSALSKLRYGTWQEYFEFIEAGRYSFMLDDGSFFFLSYEFENGGLLGHSLLFYPCPAIFTADDALENSLIDVVDYRLSERELQLFRSPIRIDYDSGNASLHHPEVHMHLNSGDCRAGIIAPMSPSMFLSTMFRFHYFETWTMHEYLQRETRFDGKPKITNEQKSWVHLMF